MDYQKIYDRIVNNAKLLDGKRSDIVERHHILPKSLGGSNDPENIVKLTLREHFIAHTLLVRIYQNDPISYKKMTYALWRMVITSDPVDRKISNRAFCYSRTKFIENNPMTDPVRKAQFIENRKAGVYKYNDELMGKTLSKTLLSMTKEAMQERMKKSVLSCDQVKKGRNISRGKASKLVMESPVGDTIEFWSYDDVLSITGYTFAQVRYRINRHNGLLPNGNIVTYIHRYTGNDPDGTIASNISK